MREVIFSRVQRPYKWKDKVIYVLENIFGFLIGLRYRKIGGASHIDKCLVDMKIAEKSFEKSASIIRGKILSVVVWECVECHRKEFWLCIEDKFTEVKE